MLQIQLISKNSKFEEIKILEVIHLPANQLSRSLERCRIDALCYLSGRLQTNPIIFMFLIFNGFGQLTRDENIKIYMPQFINHYILFTAHVIEFDNPVSHIGSNL